jgi:hypothetical protein
MKDARRNRLILLIVGGLIAVFGIAYFSAPRLTEKLYQAGLNEAESLELSLMIGVAELRFEALNDQPAELMLSTLRDLVDAELQVTGEQARRISLIQGNWNGMNLLGNQQVEWIVRLNPVVPLSLNLNIGVGDNALDLTPFDLRVVQIQSGAGELELSLPRPSATYELVWRSGAGGSRLVVPEDSALEIEAFVGAGDVDLPDELVNAGGNTWRTPNFDPEQAHIRVNFNGGAGDFELQFD